MVPTCRLEISHPPPKTKQEEKEDFHTYVSTARAHCFGLEKFKIMQTQRRRQVAVYILALEIHMKLPPFISIQFGIKTKTFIARYFSKQ